MDIERTIWFNNETKDIGCVTAVFNFGSKNSSCIQYRSIVGRKVLGSNGTFKDEVFMNELFGKLSNEGYWMLGSLEELDLESFIAEKLPGAKGLTLQKGNRDIEFQDKAFNSMERYFGSDKNKNSQDDKTGPYY